MCRMSTQTVGKIPIVGVAIVQPSFFAGPLAVGSSLSCAIGQAERHYVIRHHDNRKSEACPALFAHSHLLHRHVLGAVASLSHHDHCQSRHVTVLGSHQIYFSSHLYVCDAKFRA